jgi:hypothetical protein
LAAVFGMRFELSLVPLTLVHYHVVHVGAVPGLMQRRVL